MPNRLVVASASPRVTHNPTVTLQGNPQNLVGPNPYGDMTSEILFHAVNELLQWIDDATGLDFLDVIEPLEDLLVGATTGLLTGLVNVLTIVKRSIQAMVDAVNGIPNSLGGIVQDASEAIAKLMGFSQDAQNTADLALGILLGNVGSGLGTSGSDPFDGSVLTNPGPNYAVGTWGSASNQYYRNGAGKLVFQTSGFLGNYCVFQRTDIAFVGYATTTGLYIPQAIKSGSQLLLLNRWNSSIFGGYGALIRDINIQPVWIETPSGTPILHNLGSAWTYTKSSGEYWELDVGDVASGVMTNEYMLRVRRNGTEVASYDDSTAMTYPATGAHKNIGYAGSSGSGTSGLAWAPTIETASYYERL